MRSLSLSPNGVHFAAGAQDKSVKIFDISSGLCHHSFLGHTLDVYSLDYSSDGKLLASGSGDKTVRLWDTNEFKVRLLLHLKIFFSDCDRFRSLPFWAKFKARLMGSPLSHSAQMVDI